MHLRHKVFNNSKPKLQDGIYAIVRAPWLGKISLFSDSDIKIKVFKKKRKNFFSTRKENCICSFCQRCGFGQPTPGLSLSYTRSPLSNNPRNAQLEQQINRKKPPTQPVQHIVLRDQTGPASLKKVKQKIEAPNGRAGLIRHLGSQASAQYSQQSSLPELSKLAACTVP